MAITKHYDLLVVGSGSGLDVAVEAANIYGWNVAVVEKGPLGGTCLNRGCIPSKIIIHAADVVETINSAHKFGIKAKVQSIDFTAITKRATTYVDHESEEIEKSLRKNTQIYLYKVEGYFTDANTFKAGNTTIRADNILLAAGTRPTIPPIEGLDKITYLTSTEALRLTKQPKSMIIIGGGFIAVELGHFYGSLGTKVTIIQRSDRLIRNEDIDIAQSFTRIFSRKHEVILGYSVKKVEEKQDGTKALTLYQQSEKGGKTKKLEAEAILIATGMIPNTDILKIDKTNVETDKRGFIKINKYMETTQKRVWALGDIVGKYPFKHAANWEAQHVFYNLKGEKKYAVDYSVMPYAIFSSPQIASVGLTEQKAKDENMQYEVKRLDFINTGMGKAIEAEESFIKFIIDPKEETILGCHILGPDASTLIHEVVVAMKAAGGKISAITSSIHIHPALSEVIQRAF